MFRNTIMLVSIWAGLGFAGSGDPMDSPYDSGIPFTIQNSIDKALVASLVTQGISPANLCADTVFLRRVYLDVIGALPPPDAVRDFLRNPASDKRAAVIDDLLHRPEFADYQALRWCDVLRVKAEFPINLWPNAVQAYHRWIHNALRENMRYDAFARALMTSSGSNFRAPPVNFYRAVQDRTPEGIAAAIALTFMGARFDKWPEEQQSGTAAFFSRITYKKTDEWKEEIVCLDPAAAGPLQARFPDGSDIEVAAGVDPRQTFADWLITPENPWFARAAVNRVWAWLFGRGLVHEADDLREDNPPVHPEVLAYLEKEFIESGYDLSHLYAVILNSATYQQSPIPLEANPDAECLFAAYPVRRLDAEVLFDAICALTGDHEEFTSMIPEPFTFLPGDQRAVALADGSITSPFLEMFGRPARDTGFMAERNNSLTEAQRLHLLNASGVQRGIENSPVFRKIFTQTRGKPGEAFRRLYMTVLSRPPTPAEIAAARQYVRGTELRRGAADIAWALINSKEFLYRH